MCLFYVASLMISQVEFFEDENDIEFPVEGLATIVIGGTPPRQFGFNCRSMIENGTTVTWRRQDNQALLNPISRIDGGMQLDLTNAGQNEITTYVCTDGVMQLDITLTTGELTCAIAYT